MYILNDSTTFDSCKIALSTLRMYEILLHKVKINVNAALS